MSGQDARAPGEAVAPGPDWDAQAADEVDLGEAVSGDQRVGGLAGPAGA